MTYSPTLDPPGPGHDGQEARDAFTVACPTCASEFPVDPARVPSAGALVICSHCFRAFSVPAVGATDSETGVELGGEPPIASGLQAAPGISEPVESRTLPEVEAAPASPDEPAEEPAEEPARVMPTEPEVPASRQADRPAPVPAPPSVPPPPAPPAATSMGAGAARFGVRDPANRARRLARVLASDMITYNPARYSDARRSGRLREDFHDEIEKSWEEYVDQVGEAFASSTTHFADALNEVLAQGEHLFDGPGYPYPDS